MADLEPIDSGVIGLFIRLNVSVIAPFSIPAKQTARRDRETPGHACMSCVYIVLATYGAVLLLAKCDRVENLLHKRISFVEFVGRIVILEENLFTVHIQQD